MERKKPGRVARATNEADTDFVRIGKAASIVSPALAET
jgi:hypothetical protein